MSGEKTGAPGSRRRLLGGGAAFLAGGVVGGAARAASAAPGATPALPWRWAKLDAMEAGSRAYRYYFDPGG